ncbi:MAG: nucleoside triphosphate pyrophosphohydrolase [Candidatus Margulisiibacteriota bacterium]
MNNKQDNKKIEKLLGIVARLRAPDGCPWDREQTHETLKPYLVEETYEALEAIDHKNYKGLCEELGDILLHVVFHANLAQEEGHFNFDDVVASANNKMIHRHPHVFSDARADTVDDVWRHWEKIKGEEKKAKKEVGSVLENVPKALPSLYRADKLQRRAARIGFDWDNIAGAWEKVYEELQELKEVYEGDDKEKISEEIGDLLFSIVNISRKLNLDAEEALRGSIDKFMKRFHYIEEQTTAKGKDLQKMPLEEMDRLWREGKAKLASEQGS